MPPSASCLSASAAMGTADMAKRFHVRHMGGSSDAEGEMHFAVTGPTIDHSFAHGAALAKLIEDTLNAAYAAFVIPLPRENGR